MGVPAPEPGLVLNYAYLWHEEFRKGLEEGRKVRPSVIILCVKREDDGGSVVTVLPITHSAPPHAAAAIEIPSRVKAHLGLDDARSWVVVTEGNEFLWPGYDLHKVPRSDRFAFGFLPPRFFTQIITAFGALHAAGRAKVASRD
jgi:hypothetical protein